MEADEFWPQVPDRGQEQDEEEDDCPDEGEIEPEEGKTSEAGPEAFSDRVEECVAGQESASDDTDGTNPEPRSAPSRPYPLRKRNPPKTLTYNTLGQPSVTQGHG